MRKNIWTRMMNCGQLVLALLCWGMLIGELKGQTPVFYLDFSNDTIQDVSSNALPIDVGDDVVRVPSAGPMIGGSALDAGLFPGRNPMNGSTIEASIRVSDDILDAISGGAGGVVAWMNPEELRVGNPIFAQDLFGADFGQEFTVRDPGEVFGYTQGWKKVDGGPSRSTWGPGDPGSGVNSTPLNEWTHLAMTWNAAGDNTVYVNGVPGTTVPWDATNGPFGLNDDFADINWDIGASRGASWKNLKGMLSDVAFYDVTLTMEQVGQIMTTGVVPAPGVDGDFDQDGEVDGADFLIWQRDLGDAANLALWEGNFGTTPAVAAAAAVPEPASWMLVCTMLIAATSRRRLMKIIKKGVIG